nr:MAG TPA: hypothetical protein [Bacteriophage sp.]
MAIALKAKYIGSLIAVNNNPLLHRRHFRLRHGLYNLFCLRLRLLARLLHLRGRQFRRCSLHKLDLFHLLISLKSKNKGAVAPLFLGSVNQGSDSAVLKSHLVNIAILVGVAVKGDRHSGRVTGVLESQVKGGLRLSLVVGQVAHNILFVLGLKGHLAADLKSLREGVCVKLNALHAGGLVKVVVNNVVLVLSNTGSSNLLAGSGNTFDGGAAIVRGSKHLDSTGLGLLSQLQAISTGSQLLALQDLGGLGDILAGKQSKQLSRHDLGVDLQGAGALAVKANAVRGTPAALGIHTVGGKVGGRNIGEINVHVRNFGLVVQQNQVHNLTVSHIRIHSHNAISFMLLSQFFKPQIGLVVFSTPNRVVKVSNIYLLFHSLAVEGVMYLVHRQVPDICHVQAVMVGSQRRDDVGQFIVRVCLFPATLVFLVLRFLAVELFKLLAGLFITVFVRLFIFGRV